MRLYAAGNLKDSVAERADAACHTAGLRRRLLTYADIGGMAKDSFGFWIGEQVFGDADLPGWQHQICRCGSADIQGGGVAAC